MNEPALVYVGDPMCSWCWGFAPVLERIVETHRLPREIVVGGLRPGAAAQPLDERLLGVLLHHWEQVEATTGQPFDRSALAARSRDWRYDTEPAAAAVVTMRAFAPDVELAFFTRLQRAFYAEGADLTDPAAYPPLLDGFPVDVAGFVAAMRSAEMRRAARADFAEARRLGVTGFPTTLVRLGGRYRMIAAGYQPYEQVDQILHAVLDRFAPDAASGAACEIDGGPC
jgi:putative protein-disulfide isomerase